jgi:hypothetical protein
MVKFKLNILLRRTKTDLCVFLNSFYLVWTEINEYNYMGDRSVKTIKNYF